MRFCHLVCVDKDNNNYKFYDIEESASGTLNCTYGRIGNPESSFQHKTYNNKNFDILRLEKMRKGYQDRTEERLVIKTDNKTKDGKSEYKEIENDWTKALIEELREKQRQKVESSYNFKVAEIREKVTPKMITNARNYIGDLKSYYNEIERYGNNVISDINIGKAGTSTYRTNANNVAYTLKQFNYTLCNLYGTIERKMKNVVTVEELDFTKIMSKTFDMKGYINDIKEKINDIIENEEDLLTNIENLYRADVKKEKMQSKANSNNQTILESMGLKVEPVSYKEEDYLLDKLSIKNWENKDNFNRYVRAFKITNEKTKKAFDGFMESHNLKKEDIKNLFHGSRTENFMSIMETGLKLNANAVKTGSAFGNGHYFATNSQKSCGYIDMSGSRWASGSTNNHGYLAVFSVITGTDEKRYHPTERTRMVSESAVKGSNGKLLCTHALSKKDGGVFMDDEIIVYDNSQCTMKYLIEINAHEMHKDHMLNRKDIKLVNCFDKASLDGNEITAELDNSRISDRLQDKLNKVLTDNGKSGIDFKTDTIVFVLNLSSDRVKITSIDALGQETNVSDSLKSGDLFLLSRELKKNFFESEYNYSSFAKEYASKGLKDFTLENPNYNKSEKVHIKEKTELDKEA